jgi:hypothetical protein
MTRRFGMSRKTPNQCNARKEPFELRQARCLSDGRGRIADPHPNAGVEQGSPTAGGTQGPGGSAESKTRTGPPTS